MDTCEWYDLGCHIDWAFDELTRIIINLFSGVLGGFASIFESIPVPGFLQNIGSFGLPEGVLYFLDLFVVADGAAIIVSAFGIRFLIRRLPFIG